MATASRPFLSTPPHTTVQFLTVAFEFLVEQAVTVEWEVSRAVQGAMVKAQTFTSRTLIDGPRISTVMEVNLCAAWYQKALHITSDVSDYPGDQVSSVVESNFRKIPWGDVDLQREIYVDDRLYDELDGERKRRKVVDGRDFIVANYHSKSAEQNHYTLLIRRSTGRLCIDLAGNDHRRVLVEMEPDRTLHNTSPLELLSFVDPSRIFKLMSPKQFHSMWKVYQSYGHLALPFTAPVMLGSVYRHTSTEQHNTIEVIALNHNCAPDIEDWVHDYYPSDAFIFKLDNGWTRLSYCDRNNSAEIHFSLAYGLDNWVSQANHIFCGWRISPQSNGHQYAIVRLITFRLTLGIGRHLPNKPQPYLFLCPTKDFQLEPMSPVFKWPDRGAYWSLDPSGTGELSIQQAKELGLPTIQLSTHVWVSSWDDSVYVALREFHRREGFDPARQDPAIHLKEPLLKLFSDEFLFVAEDDEAVLDYGTISEANGINSEEEEHTFGEAAADEDTLYSSGNTGIERMDVSPVEPLLQVLTRPSPFPPFHTDELPDRDSNAQQPPPEPDVIVADSRIDRSRF
ncbi:hypothetical protein R3P38DRAFT_3234460 [Favolaschia claudopus]|uniref:Uncharacterized protein n=1 Tax=Favolaschia claudopus TaxID=2862362 RepID=A0AAV9ZGE4_9AGAR